MCVCVCACALACMPPPPPPPRWYSEALAHGTCFLKVGVCFLNQGDTGLAAGPLCACLEGPPYLRQMRPRPCSFLLFFPPPLPPSLLLSPGHRFHFQHRDHFSQSPRLASFQRTVVNGRLFAVTSGGSRASWELMARLTQPTCGRAPWGTAPGVARV